MSNYISMYNLSHLYFYEEIEGTENKIIELLLHSSQYFIISIELLCIVLMKKYNKNITFDIILNECKLHQKNNTDQNTKLACFILNYIKKSQLDNPINYELKYQKFKNIDFSHDFEGKTILTKLLIKENDIEYNTDIQMQINITDEFYEGFGFRFN